MVVDNDTWDVIQKLLPYNIEELKEAVFLIWETWIKYDFTVIPFWSLVNDVKSRILMDFKWLLNNYWVIIYSNPHDKWEEALQRDLLLLTDKQKEELGKNKIFKYMSKTIWLELI